jgi:hypothetical protein
MCLKGVKIPSLLIHFVLVVVGFIFMVFMMVGDAV